MNKYMKFNIQSGNTTMNSTSKTIIESDNPKLIIGFPYCLRQKIDPRIKNTEVEEVKKNINMRKKPVIINKKNIKIKRTNSKVSLSKSKFCNIKKATSLKDLTTEYYCDYFRQETLLNKCINNDEEISNFKY